MVSAKSIIVCFALLSAGASGVLLEQPEDQEPQALGLTGAKKFETIEDAKAMTAQELRKAQETERLNRIQAKRLKAEERYQRVQSKRKAREEANKARHLRHREQGEQKAQARNALFARHEEARTARLEDMQALRETQEAQRQNRNIEQWKAKDELEQQRAERIEAAQKVADKEHMTRKQKKAEAERRLYLESEAKDKMKMEKEAARQKEAKARATIVAKREATTQKVSWLLGEAARIQQEMTYHRSTRYSVDAVKPLLESLKGVITDGNKTRILTSLTNRKFLSSCANYTVQTKYNINQLMEDTLGQTGTPLRRMLVEYMSGYINDLSSHKAVVMEVSKAVQNLLPASILVTAKNATPPLVDMGMRFAALYPKEEDMKAAKSTMNKIFNDDDATACDKVWSAVKQTQPRMEDIEQFRGMLNTATALVASSASLLTDNTRHFIEGFLGAARIEELTLDENFKETDDKTSRILKRSLCKRK